MIINKPSEMSEKEAKIYVDYLEEKYQRKVAELTICRIDILAGGYSL